MPVNPWTAIPFAANKAFEKLTGVAPFNVLRTLLEDDLINPIGEEFPEFAKYMRMAIGLTPTQYSEEELAKAREFARGIASRIHDMTIDEEQDTSSASDTPQDRLLSEDDISSVEAAVEAIVNKGSAFAKMALHLIEGVLPKDDTQTEGEVDGQEAA